MFFWTNDQLVYMTWNVDSNDTHRESCKCRNMTNLVWKWCCIDVSIYDIIGHWFRSSQIFQKLLIIVFLALTQYIYIKIYIQCMPFHDILVKSFGKHKYHVMWRITLSFLWTEVLSFYVYILQWIVIVWSS